MRRWGSERHREELLLCSLSVDPLDMMRVSESPHKSNRVADWKVTATNITHSTFRSIISTHLLSCLLHSPSLRPLPLHPLFIPPLLLFFLDFHFSTFFMCSLSSLYSSLFPPLFHRFTPLFLPHSLKFLCIHMSPVSLPARLLSSFCCMVDDELVTVLTAAIAIAPAAP